MPDNVSFSWPLITVLICTYERAFELGATFGSLTKNLLYPNIHWHLADDGSKDETFHACALRIQSYALEHDQEFSFSITPRLGWGANVNTAMEQCGEIVFFTEDDHVLKRPLDLRPYVAALMLHSRVGMVRFGVAGHDGLPAVVRELDISPIVPEYRDCLGEGAGSPGKMNVWEIELGVKPTRGLYGFWRYSNRPHLKHRRFHDAYGPYSERRGLADTEMAMNFAIEDIYTSGGGVSPAIVVPFSWCGWHFDHIGKSRQGTEEDNHG